MTNFLRKEYLSYLQRRCWVAFYIHTMIFYLMFALRCQQADFVASVSPLVLLTPGKVIAGVVTGDT